MFHMKTREPLQLLVCILLRDALVINFTLHKVTIVIIALNMLKFTNVMVLEVQSYGYMYMKYVMCTWLHVTNAVRFKKLYRDPEYVVCNIGVYPVNPVSRGGS